MVNYSKINILSTILLTSSCLAACVSTQVMPVAPNAVQINTQASGLLSRGKAVPETMVAAAKETLSRGYTHFKFSSASSGQGSEVYGATSFGSGNINGNTYGNNFGANYNSYGVTNINRRHTEAAAATVVMFHAGDAGARGAFDARKVLSQYQQ